MIAGEPIQPSTPHYVDALINRARVALEHKAVIGQAGPNSRYALPDEEEIIVRVRHTMRAGEPLVAWFARVGLGRAQILTMSKSEITAFVAQADANNAASSIPVPLSFQ